MNHSFRKFRSLGLERTPKYPTVAKKVLVFVEKFLIFSLCSYLSDKFAEIVDVAII